MFSLEFLIQMLLSMIGAYLIKPASAAKYAKWFIRLRNFLNLLFPVETYPVDWKGTNIDAGKPDQYAVPVEAVKQAAKEKGFNIPFIKGI
jgi:hypothetical protein